jgi:hypothetical protein
LEVASVPGTAADHTGDPRSDSPFGRGERRLGCSQDPQRVAKARIRRYQNEPSLVISADFGGAAIPKRNWLAFLRNHREAIVSLDFFTVPTATFRLLYCLFVIEHGRRRILHFNVTAHPTADWVVQQLRETFAEAGPYHYTILDHDAKFDGNVIAFLNDTGLKPKRTSVGAPGKTGSRSAGSAARGVRFLITSSR